MPSCMYRCVCRVVAEVEKTVEADPDEVIIDDVERMAEDEVEEELSTAVTPVEPDQIECECEEVDCVEP